MTACGLEPFGDEVMQRGMTSRPVWMACIQASGPRWVGAGPTIKASSSDEYDVREREGTGKCREAETIILAGEAKCRNASAG